MGRLKLAVSGHGECGKDYVCRRLSELTGLLYEHSTSRAAAGVVYTAMSDRYSSVEACWADRRNHRQLWHDMMHAYNTPNKVRLYEEMSPTNDILNGIRRKEQLLLCQRCGLVDLSIWVERPVPPDPMMDYGAEACDITIHNTGDLGFLDQKLARIADLLI